MIKISNIKLPIKHHEKLLKEKVLLILKEQELKLKNFEIVGKSIDARDKNDMKYVYSVILSVANEKKYLNYKNVSDYIKPEYTVNLFPYPVEKRPIVIGSGPAGMFAALILAEKGLCPIIIEQGQSVNERKENVFSFFETGELNVNSNVQFGEGGAGTFSDGKLTTGTKDIRITKVIDELIKIGAPKEIAFLQKPHLGTDKLISIVENVRNRIISLGGEYFFDTKLTKINHENNVLNSIDVISEGIVKTIQADYLILAIGHSSRETFRALHEQGLKMLQKNFAVGLRIEHKQSFINESQYGKNHASLPPAEYNFAHKSNNGKGVYTFCMCPGGLVVPASSEENRLVVNGMSYFKRDLENSNCAILANVTSSDFNSTEPLAGIDYQESLEDQAFILGGSNYFAPVQNAEDYINNFVSTGLQDVTPSYPLGYTFADLNKLFSDEINQALKEGLRAFDKKIPGFTNDAVLTGVESRSSSPIKILRDDNGFSNIKGVIPCGEGSGYSGGIMSSSVDGIRCAEYLVDALLASYNSIQNDAAIADGSL